MSLPGPLRLIAPLPFVGRSEELRALETLWAEVAAGGGRVALVAAEPGGGKSRLAREFAHRTAADGAVVLYGACDAQLSSPYQPFVEMLEEVVGHGDPGRLREALGPRGGELARLVPDLAQRVTAPPALAAPAGADPDTERHRLHGALGGLLGGLASDAPVLLILEDLHWADAPTLLALRHLARTGVAPRVLVLATLREGAEGLAGTLAELRRLDGILRLTLGGLDAADVAELLGGLPGAAPELAGELAALTGGNAFLVAELCSHLAAGGTLDDGVPRGVLEVAGDRLAALGPDAREVLEIVALSGRGMELGALAAAAAVADLPAALDDGVRSGLLDEVPGPPIALRLRHELLRRAVYDAMSSLRRATLHRRAGEALERACDAEGTRAVNELAFHFAGAVPIAGSERAVSYALAAAEAAMRSLAYQAAAEHLRRALELGVADPALRARAHWNLGTAEHRAGQAPGALASFAAAAGLAREIGDADMLARAAIGFETACWRPGLDDPRTIALLEEAAHAAAGDDPPLRVRLLAHLSRALANRGEHAVAGARWREAMELAERIGDRHGLAVALFHASWTRGSRSAAEVLDEVTRASELAAALGDEELRAEARGFRVSLLVESYEMDQARCELARQRELVERAGQPFYRHVVEYMESTIALCDGRLATAEAAAERAFELSLQLERAPSGAYGIQMFSLRREQGRLAEVAPLVRAVAGDAGHHDAWGSALCVLLAEIGDLDAARTELVRLAAHDFGRVPAGALWLVSMSYLADACVAVGDRELASRLYERLLPCAGQNVIVGEAVSCYGAADRFLGALAATLGDWEAGERHLEIALELNGRMGSPTWLAHTRREHARLLLRRGAPGDRERAAAMLAEALATARRTGMAGLERRIAQLAADPPAPDGLSAREVAVLRLVARGLSNREIGAELFISEHTVANHVRSILFKTGCANRTEASSYAHRRRLVDPV